MSEEAAHNQKAAITPTREADFPGWYQEVVRAAELASMSHVRGCMVIKPWGYGIWERMQWELDRRIRSRGVENAYFPIFLPLSYLQKEAEHAEGFAKEMAVVTHHRLEKQDGKLVPAAPLEEPLVVRPTSETIIGESMAEWVQSYRDLPLKLNQWSNVVRWEMRPRVLLRTTEFLWQEGHTAHATEVEAVDQTVEMHQMYRTFVEDFLAIPTLPGDKSPTERFPGASQTLTIEAMMQDGKALQAGTSHYLGQSFARAANIDFSDDNGRRRYAYTTSWGFSTRMVGALVMTHADDNGMRVPPSVAPHQVVVVPLVRGGQTDGSVLAYAKSIADAVQATNTEQYGPVRVLLDDRPTKPVDKKWQWIKRGTPILIEAGAKDKASNVVSFRNRARPEKVERRSLNDFVRVIGDELVGAQQQLLAGARERLAAGLHRDVTTREAAEAFFTEEQLGFVLAGWCGRTECELALKPLGATIRCLPSEERAESDHCLVCGKTSRHSAAWALSY